MPSFNHKGLYAIIDSKCHAEFGLEKLMYEIVKNSEIPVIQFRIKKMSLYNCKEIITKAASLKSIRKFTLIVNDEFDLLSLPEVDGLHLGQSDIAFGMARKSNTNKIMGLSTHNLEQAQLAQVQKADYIGCGSIYPTNTKNETTPLGLQNLKEISEKINIPKVAIGGIRLDTIEEVSQTGCDMAASISGLINNGKFVGQTLHEKFLLHAKRS